jgi:hemerythrin-like domain-containing protein
MTTIDRPDCETPDLTGYRLVHRGLIWGSRHLAAATGRDLDERHGRELAAWTRGFLGELHTHHMTEDEVFFPALVRRVPVAAALIERTDVEHHALDDVVERIEHGLDRLEAGDPAPELARAFVDLADLMVRHLAFEDAEILPLFERHFSAEAYRELDEGAVKKVGVSRQALFTVPFILGMADQAEHAHMWSLAPVPLKLIARLTRRGYARRTARVFGPAALTDAQVA